MLNIIRYILFSEEEKRKTYSKMNKKSLNRAGYEGFELLGFKFEMEDTAFSMAATAVFMVLFYFGLYIRHCVDDDTIGIERFKP